MVQSARLSLSVLWIFRSVSVSTEAVASSCSEHGTAAQWNSLGAYVASHPAARTMTMILDLRTRARAMQISCRWPMEKFAPFSITGASSCKGRAFMSPSSRTLRSASLDHTSRGHSRRR